MKYTKKKTTYHFETSSKSVVKAIEITLSDHKARKLLNYFSKIKSCKKRNVILRMTEYLRQEN